LSINNTGHCTPRREDAKYTECRRVRAVGGQRQPTVGVGPSEKEESSDVRQPAAPQDPDIRPLEKQAADEASPQRKALTGPTFPDDDTAMTISIDGFGAVCATQLLTARRRLFRALSRPVRGCTGGATRVICESVVPLMRIPTVSAAFGSKPAGCETGVLDRGRLTSTRSVETEGTELCRIVSW
jgi:hypothetical protein